MTLPVELDASRRSLRTASSTGVSWFADKLGGAKKVSGCGGADVCGGGADGHSPARAGPDHVRDSRPVVNDVIADEEEACVGSACLAGANSSILGLANALAAALAEIAVSQGLRRPLPPCGRASRCVGLGPLGGRGTSSIPLSMTRPAFWPFMTSPPGDPPSPFCLHAEASWTECRSQVASPRVGQDARSSASSLSWTAGVRGTGIRRRCRHATPIGRPERRRGNPDGRRGHGSITSFCGSTPSARGRDPGRLPLPGRRPFLGSVAPGPWQLPLDPR